LVLDMVLVWRLGLLLGFWGRPLIGRFATARRAGLGALFFFDRWHDHTPLACSCRAATKRQDSAVITFESRFRLVGCAALM
jgi:hypothetical protein